MTKKNEMNNKTVIDDETFDDEIDMIAEDPIKIRDYSTPEDDPVLDDDDFDWNDDVEDVDLPFDDEEFDENDDIDKESLDDDDDDVDNEENPFEDDSNDDEYEDDEEDLFAMVKPKRISKLPEDEYLSIVGEVKAEKMPNGKFGKPWVRVTIPFDIKHPKTKETITVPFFANKSTGKNSRLYPIIKGILGHVPDEEYSLKDLIGKKVRVEIEHNQDDEGNVWENVVLVRPFKPKKN